MTTINSRPINPYIAGKALKQRDGFFGRDDILNLVETDLRMPDRSVIVLFGQRRIGKTSILLQLEQRLPAPPFVAVHFDLMDRARQPLGRLLHDMAAALADELELDIAVPATFDDEGRYFRQTFLPTLYQHLGSEQRAVLLFDEFDVLDVAAEENLPATAAARAFFPYLRQLIEETSLGFVFVVGRRAEDLSIDIKATFKAARYKRVSVLNLPDARRLITLAEQQGSLQFASSAVDHILMLTKGHPYLTQLFCQILWDNAYVQPPVTVPTIEVPDVERAVSQVLEAGQHAFEWIWDGLPPAERVIFAAIAEATEEGSVIAEDDLLELLQSHGIRILVRELELAPKTLVEWEMLRKVDGGYTFAVELLRRWVAENKPLPRVRDELDRVVPFAETLYRGGEGWYQQRNLENARDQLRQALQVNPNHLKARLLMGQVLIEQEQLDAAIDELEQAYQYDGDAARLPLVRALLEKAHYMERDAKPDAALVLYERVLTLSPRERVAREQYQTIWLARGHAALEAEDFDGAIHSYQQAGAHDKIQQVWITRGNNALQVNNLDAALQFYEQAGAHDKIQQVTERKRQQQYEKILRTAQQHEQGEEWEKALEIYQRLANEFPDDTSWDAILERVQAEQRLRTRYAEGIGSFEQKDWSQAQRALADVIYTRPDYKDAAELLSQAVRSVRVPQTLSDRVPESPVPDPPEPPKQRQSLLLSSKRQYKLSLTLFFIGIAGLAGSVIVQTTAQANIWIVISLGIMGLFFVTWSLIIWHETDADLRIRSQSLCIRTIGGFDLALGVAFNLGGFRSAHSVAFSPDGQTALSGGDDKTVRLWDVTTGEQIRVFTGHGDDVRSVAFSPDGQTALSGGDDKTVRLWDVSTGEQIRVFTGHSSYYVRSVAFSPDGQTALSGSWDKTVRLWDVSTGEQIKVFTGHSRYVNSVAFSPDGQTALSGGDDKTVQLWDVSTGEQIRVFTGHRKRSKNDGVNSVAFSPDGLTALSGADDETVRFWDVATGLEFERFMSQGSIYSIAISPSGRMALFGGHKLYLCHMPTEE